MANYKTIKTVGITTPVFLTSVINVNKATALPGQATNTIRYQRLKVLQQCHGQTVAQFYAKCNKAVAGNVSKKLFSHVVCPKGIATLTTADGKPVVFANTLKTK